MRQAMPILIVILGIASSWRDLGKILQSVFLRFLTVPSHHGFLLLNFVVASLSTLSLLAAGATLVGDIAVCDEQAATS
jgi:hypothetical protein